MCKGLVQSPCNCVKSTSTISVSCFFSLLQQDAWPKPLKGEGFILTHSLELQSIRQRKSRRQELEAVGYTVSTGRKQREMNAGGQLNYYLIQSGMPTHGMGTSVAREGLPSSISLISKMSCKHAQMLGPVELPVNIITLS